MAALIAIVAGWATYRGTLPQFGQQVLGALIEGTAWAGLYAGLGLAYSSAALPDRQSTRRLLCILGLCVLLAIFSTYLCELVVTAVGTPVAWGKLFYLKRLAPPMFVALWCAVLLPRETHALVRDALATPALVPLPHLVILLVSAAVLVSCADLAFEWSASSAVEAWLKGEVIYRSAWAANVLILFGAYGSIFALTLRVPIALLLVSAPYVAWCLATLTKIKYMHSAIQPLDLVKIREFLPFAPGYLGTWGIAVTLGGMALWFGALLAARKLEPCSMPRLRRWSMCLVSLAFVLAFPAAFFASASVPMASSFLTLVQGMDRDREFREMARTSGFLLSFISELPTMFPSMPPDYSPATVANALGKHCRPDDTAAQGRGQVNLIVYLVESFMDPDDLGFQYTADPIPNVRELRSAYVGGYGIVPEEFGGSASTEFEALTGMTTSFLPHRSVPYRLYLKHPIPSLPGMLRQLGYATTAVQADPRFLYDRERVYPLLGFDSVVWLHEAPGVERAPGAWWASDQAVVRAVIQATQQAHPAFVFAFPSSTHGPYNRGTYRDSELNVRDLPETDATNELQEYINRLRAADQAIGTLVEYFRGRSDSTIIAVLGDHVAPLSGENLRTFSLRLAGLSPPEQMRRLRRVPLLVWANFALPREEPELSINALPSYLLEKMGIHPTGFLAMSDAVRRRLPVLGNYVQGDNATVWNWDSLSADERQLLEDYQLLQYDLLLGKRYSLRDSASTAVSCGATTKTKQLSSHRGKSARPATAPDLRR